MEHFRALVHVPARGKNHKNTEKYDRKSTRYEMLSSERPPQMLHKRRRSGKDKSWASSTGVTTLEDIVHGPESQGRQARDGLDDSSSASTYTGSNARLGLLETPTIKDRYQLTPTEYALQEIRSRVRAIDERWEEVNVRATDTIEKIEENGLDRRVSGRKERWPGASTSTRQDAVRKFSLRGGSAQPGGGIHLSRSSADLLDESKAAAWLVNIKEIGRTATSDERLAVALAQSHESLAAASVKFEETQQRNQRLLEGLRGWMDGFTGTARPEDTNPIAAMLPEPRLEDEVVNLMAQCKDAASTLEQMTKQHTAQLGEIFCQAGKMYGAEIDRVQRKGMKATGAAQGRIASLEKHANKVETLLESMEDERDILQKHFRLAEERCGVVEERWKKTKDLLEEALNNYRHKVIQLERVVAGYEEKARKEEQLGRDPALGPVLETFSPASLPNTYSSQLQQLQTETARLCSENAVLLESNKKLNHDLVVLRLGNQDARQIVGSKKRIANPTPPSLQDESDPQQKSGAEAREAVRVAKDHADQTQRELAEAQKDNQTLVTRLQTVLMELEKEKQRPTVVNNPSADTIEQGLRKAIRDLRSETSIQLEKEAEARRRAVDKLHALQNEARNKEKNAAAAAAEIDRLQAELNNKQEQLKSVKELFDSAQGKLDNTQDQLQTQAPHAIEDRTKKEVMTVEATLERVPQALSPVDYRSLVERAIGKGGVGLTELRKETQDAGMAERYYDKAQNIFSGIVDSFGEGLASVEQILQGSTVIVDQDASKIQEVLALTLERALTSASLLLKEALVGRTRACVAEKRASLERETVDYERTKAITQAQEKNERDKPHQQLGQGQASTTEIEQEALCSENTGLQERVAAVNSLDHAPLTLVDDGATWRLRYEHLAGLMVDMTKKSNATEEDLLSAGSPDVSDGRSTAGINTIEDQPHSTLVLIGGNDRSKSECDDLKLDDKKRKDGAATNGDNSSNGTNAGGIDEDEMLTKLFDTRTPPVIVEAGHQKLLNKFLKSRDENKIRREVATKTTQSSPPSCQECTLLRKELADRCAEIAMASEQHLVAQEELEASQYRVYVLSSDIAALQRKLAEHTEVVDRARSLADAIASAPGTDTHEAREVLDLKELSDRVTDRIESGSGSRVPRSTKDNATAAALKETPGGRLPGSTSSRGENLQAPTIPSEVPSGEGLGGNLQYSSDNAASGHGQRLLESNSSRLGENVSGGSKGDHSRRSRSFSATMNQGSFNGTRERNKPDPLAVDSIFSTRSMSAVEDASDPTKAATDTATRGETQASPISMKIDENSPSVHKTAASRNTTPAEHVEIGGGNDTCSDGEKCGDALIADSLPPYFQDRVTTSTIAGDVEGDGVVATTEADKGGGQPREPGMFHHTSMLNTAPAASDPLQEASTSRQEASVMPRIEESMFVSEEISLVGYCEVAARCKIAIEGLQGSCDQLVEIGVKQCGGGLVADSRDQFRWLTCRYSELTHAMMEWGVEAAAALLVEISRTAIKLDIISGWIAATTAGVKRGREERGGGGSLSEARRDRARLLVAKKLVLREVIKNLGGWKAAVYFDSGGVNLDVDVSVWPIKDQLAILSALNDHLREEMEKRGERHTKALTDLQHRLHESQEESGRRERVERQLRRESQSQAKDGIPTDRQSNLSRQTQNALQAQPRITPQDGVVPRGSGDERGQNKKYVDLIVEADLAERRAQEEEDARLRTGYPLVALAAERRAICELRKTLTKALCAVLEICRPIAEASEAAPDKRWSKRGEEWSPATSVENTPYPPSDSGATGPPSTLVHMVYNGEGANVCCAADAYKLCTGMIGRTPSADLYHKAVGHRYGPSSTSSSIVPPSLLSPRETSLHQDIAEVNEERSAYAPECWETACAVPSLPPADPRKALVAARAAASTIPFFSADVCNIDVSARGDRVSARVDDGKPLSDCSTDANKVLSCSNGIIGGASSHVIAEGFAGGNNTQDVDTTATAKIVHALRTDSLWARVLPSFVRKTLKMQAGQVGQQAWITEREIELLAEAQGELRRELRSIKADYVSADADDVIRALRKRVRELDDKVRSQERQLQIVQESCEVEGGAIEVLEGLLRQRDIDKKLSHGLGMKSLEIGLKIRLLEDQKVSHLSQHEQRAVAHLKERLIKERVTLNTRKRTVAAQLQRSLPHCMQAFERVSRAIRRLCDGYSSLSGLLEWGRLTVARFQASERDCKGRKAFDNGGDFDDSDGFQTSVDFDGARATSFSRAGAMTTGPRKGERHHAWMRQNLSEKQAPAQHQTGRATDTARLHPAEGGRVDGPFKSQVKSGYGLLSPVPHLSFSASTASLPVRCCLSRPSGYPPASAEDSLSLPDTSKGALKVLAPGQVASRRLRARVLETNFKKGRRSSGGGVLSAVEYGQPVPGSALDADKSSAKTLEERHNDLSSVSGPSSVAQLLREEKAYRQRANALHGGPDKQVNAKECASARSPHNVPALVPLNNVGMPVRFRQQPRRTQALHATR